MTASFCFILMRKCPLQVIAGMLTKTDGMQREQRWTAELLSAESIAGADSLYDCGYASLLVKGKCYYSVY